jgi:1-phosphofructokinase
MTQRLLQPVAGDEAHAALLAPSPILTVTLEHAGHEPELHLHAGGQGFWVARMLRALGVGVAFCAPLGGEVGAVLRALLEAEALDLHAVETGGSNGAYVHDRGPDGVVVIGETPSPALTRHEADALYGSMLSVALEAHVAVVTGPRAEHVVEPDFYRRLAGDLRRNGCTVVADLSRRELASALAGGVDLLHLSERELGEHVGATLSGVGELVEAMAEVHDEGAGHVVVSRGPEPALVLLDGQAFELLGPVFEAREHRGAGDSMFAAIAASLARGPSLEDALRLGAAAGAMNVVRRGLGSGTRADIERLAGEVSIRPLDSPAVRRTGARPSDGAPARRAPGRRAQER